MDIRSIAKACLYLALAGNLNVAARAQSAPIPNFNNYVRLSPDTKAGLGASATLFNGAVYLAMKGMGNNNFYLSTTTNGSGVTTTSRSDGEFALLNFAPSITVYNNSLYMAFTDGYGHVYLTNSGGGAASSFSTPQLIYEPGQYGNYLMPNSPPTLVVFNGYLYVFFELVDQANGNQIQSLYYDGSSWHASGSCAYVPRSVASGATDHSAVGAAVFNSKLVVGAQIGSSSTSNVLSVCTATGVSDPGNFITYSSINPEGGIAAGLYNGGLYFAFKSNSTANYLVLTGTKDGTTFTTPGVFFDGIETTHKIQINGTAGYEIAPALLTFNSDLWVYYTANDNTHYLYEIRSF